MGDAPRGERALDAVPHGRWRTTTVVAALRADGIVAPLVLEGAIDGPSFLAYVQQVLAYSWIYASRLGLPSRSLDQIAAGEFPRFAGPEEVTAMLRRGRGRLH